MYLKDVQAIVKSEDEDQTLQPICLPIREIIHWQMLAEHLLVQVDKPWHNYYRKGYPKVLKYWNT